LQTDASGAPVRLEYVRGRMKWEASPASRHQKALRRIERAIESSAGAMSGCGCYTLADVLIRFPDPDGSRKRPDIAIFCAEPPDSDEALEVLTSAIVEILSVGYEEKDLGADGARFYLAYVPEVLVVDPRGGVVHHYRVDRPPVRYAAPITVELQCGCRVVL